MATKNPAAVENEVRSAYLAMYPCGDADFIPRAFGWVVACFEGHYDGYQAVDARYHDLEHTMQGTLCMTRLMAGRHRAGAKPPLSQRFFELGIVAMLLHDTGYLKTSDDLEGTGAKYTRVHVRRSADFAAKLMAEKGFAPHEIKSVQNMILCTGVNAALDRIPFQSELEKLTGFALATGDLLGQMAAPDYVDKIPVLYEEFVEAVAYDPAARDLLAGISSAGDLKRHTPRFWREYVLPKLDAEFGGVYRYLNEPYPNGENAYLRHVELNIRRLEED